MRQKKDLKRKLSFLIITLGIVNIIITFSTLKFLYKTKPLKTTPKAKTSQTSDSFYIPAKEKYTYALKELAQLLPKDNSVNKYNLQPVFKKVGNKIFLAYKNSNTSILFLQIQESKTTSFRSFDLEGNLADIGLINNRPVLAYLNKSEPVKPGSALYFTGVYLKDLTTGEIEKISQPYTNNSLAKVVNNQGILYSTSYIDARTKLYKINRLVFAYKDENNEWKRLLLDDFVFPSGLSTAVYKNFLYVAYDSITWVPFFAYKSSTQTSSFDSNKPQTEPYDKEKLLNLIYKDNKKLLSLSHPSTWLIRIHRQTKKISVIKNPFVSQKSTFLIPSSEVDPNEVLNNLEISTYYYLLPLPVVKYAKLDLSNKKWVHSKIISENIPLSIKRGLPIISQLPSVKIVDDKLKFVWSDSRGRVRKKTFPGMGTVYFLYTSNNYGRNLDLKTHFLSPEFKITSNGYVYLDKPSIGTINIDNKTVQVVANKYYCFWKLPWCPQFSMYLGIEMKKDEVSGLSKDIYEKQTILFSSPPITPVFKIFEVEDRIFFLKEGQESLTLYQLILSSK